nr:putative uncharacterized protein DDB_G0282133 isoform X1 [Leptinotarsa decemlineata]
MDYTEMVPNAKQISNIPSSFPVENDFREIPMEFTINLTEPVEIQNSTNFNQQHLERKSNNNFTNVEHFNSRPQTPNEEPDGSSLMTKNINQNDIKKDSARISKKSTEDLRDTNLIPVTNNKTILPPSYFKLDENTPCKITEGDNTNINNTAFNKLKDVTGLGKNFICETNDNLTKNTNKQIADNGNEAPETKNKILYSEPGHLLMKHDNFLPAFKNHLVTPTTSFAMDVSNMSPSIEDTQQLIHATFSKPESINVLLKGQKYPESKVNENKTDSKDDISITHVNELSDTLKETNQLDLLEDQTAKLHTENNKSCWDLTNNSDNILSNITPEIVDVDDSIALGEEASSEQRVSLVNDSIALGEEASSKRQVSLVDDSIASGKEATSEKKDFVLDDSIALGEQVPIPREMEPESEASLESTLDNVDYQNYTMRSNHILSNIKKHLINIEPDPYFEESASRCEKICNTFWKDWDQIKSFLEEYRMPTINIVNVEEYFTEKEDDSSRISEGLSSDEFESQRRLSLPDLAPLKSLQERVTEAAERSGKYWQFVKSENDYYYFSCLFRSIRFKVHVHPGLGLVYSIQTENKLEEMSSSFSHYVTKVLELKLKQEHLLSSLGTKFDLLTLLDYVCLCIDEIVSFHKEFDQLGSKYGSSHKLSMHPDNRVTFEILRFNFIIWWTISIDMSLTNLGCKERVTAKCNLNEPVNEEDIKQIAEKCLNGMNFLRNFIEKVDEYVERIGKRILCRRKATRQYMNY